VEPLAQALGVTKGGFYWHFADRQALLEEMLDSWERRVLDEVVEHIDRSGGDARARLRRLFGLAADLGDLLAVELAIREWGRRDPEVSERLRRVDDRRMEYMRSLFGEFIADPDDVEARCLLVSTLFIGNRFVTAGHGRRSRADVARHALRWLLR
jgi:AcrR family transcriptional regulator